MGILDTITISEEKKKKERILDSIILPTPEEAAAIKKIVIPPTPQPVPEKTKGIVDTIKDFGKKLEVTTFKFGTGKDVQPKLFSETPVGRAAYVLKQFPDQVIRSESDLRKGLRAGVLDLSSSVKRFDEIFYETIGADKTAAKMRQGANLDKELAGYLAREGVVVNDQRKLAEKMADPKWFYRTLGQTAPSALASIGVAVPLGIASPVLGTAGAVAVGGAVVFGQAYDDAISGGVPKDKAKKIAGLVAIGSGMLEALPAWRIISKMTPKPALDVVKQSFINNVKNRVKSVVIQGVTEGGTESLQTLYENAWKKTYRENQPLLQGVAESGIFGAILGAGTDVALQTGVGARNVGAGFLPPELKPAGTTLREPEKVTTGIVETLKAVEAQPGTVVTKGSEGQKVVEVPAALDTTPIKNMDIPPAVEAKAQIDWEDNYADKFRELSLEYDQREKELKITKGDARAYLQESMDKISQQMGAMEDGFIAKYQKLAREPQPKKEKPTVTSPSAHAPIREVNGNKVKVPTSKTVYTKGNVIVGKYKGKPYTTDTFLLEFQDVGLSQTNPRGTPTNDVMDQLIKSATTGAKDIGTPQEISSNAEASIVDAIFKLDGKDIVIDTRYYNYLSNKYKNLVMKTTGEMKPIAVYDGGELKGLIMPKNGKLPGAKVTKVERVTPKKEVVKAKIAAKSAVKRGVASEDGDLGNLASPQGTKTITKMLERRAAKDPGEGDVVPKDFKVSARAKQILDELGIVSGERELSNRFLGLYKPGAKKVRVQSFYDITTVVHEGIHGIDDQIDFTKDLILSTGRGAKIRKQLTDIYNKLYPDPKKSAKLKERLQEGLAVLFENYFYDPATTVEAYPELVDAFIRPSGTYYNPLFTKLLDGMNDLVDDYARLSPEERIGARIRTGREVVDKNKGFTFRQRAVYEIFNPFEPLKRYAKAAEVTETWDDPMVQAFNILNINSIKYNWVKGNKRAILMRDGNFDIKDGSIADYLNIIKGREKTFSQYLIARRVHEMNNTVASLENELSDIDGENEAEGEIIESEIERLKEIIRRDDFSAQDAAAVVKKYNGEFDDAVKIYDQINQDLITFAEENDLIDSETADKYRAEEGYSSFQRFIEDELDTTGTVRSSSQSKVSGFKERTGSNLDIIDPVYSQIMAINEVINKSMHNRLWNKVAGLASKKPEIAQRFERIEAKPSVRADGTLDFSKQENDPNIIRIFVRGKRQFYKAAPEFLAIVKNLKGGEVDVFVQALMIPTSIFTRLTTSANPFFAAGNFTVDQFSAVTQSKTGFVPIIDPIKGLINFIKSDKGMQAYIALGGKRQTLAAFYDLSPEEITHKLTGGQTKMEKVGEVVDTALGVAELPSNLSEIITRYSEYKRSVERGEPMSVAMYRASEITTPFQLQGNFWGKTGRALNKAIPYFNAILQVIYKYGRTVKTNPERVATLTAGLLATALTTAILIMKEASPEQKRLLGNQPAKNFSRNIYIPSWDKKTLIHLRIPEQVGALTGLVYLWVIGAYGGNKATFDDYADVVMSAVPEQINLLEPKKAILSVAPQVLKPSAMVVTNTRVYPEVAPIVPYYMAQQAPEKQYNAYTSDFGKTLGVWTGTSPMMIDFWVKNQFGPVGNFFISGKLPQDGKPLTIQEEEFVMAGRAYNHFYDNREIVTQQYQEMVKDNPKNYTREDRRTIKDENEAYNEVAEILSDMRKLDIAGDIPEDIRSGMYKVLLKFDSTENIRDTRLDVRDVKLRVREELRAIETREREAVSSTQPPRLLSLVNNVLGVKTASAAGPEETGGGDLTVKSLKFSENGIPYFWMGKRPYYIDKLHLNTAPIKPIKKLIIDDARGDKYSRIITDPEKLKVAQQIARISNTVAPEYTNYLLRLAEYEGTLNPKEMNVNKKDKSVDRGVFQINNKAFPQITDEKAQNIEFATLWAISLIQAGKQHKWVADQYIKNKVKLKIES